MKCIVTYFWTDQKDEVREGKTTLQIPDYIWQKGDYYRKDYALDVLSKKTGCLVEIRELVSNSVAEMFSSERRGRERKEVDRLINRLISGSDKKKKQ